MNVETLLSAAFEVQRTADLIALTAVYLHAESGSSIEDQTAMELRALMLELFPRGGGTGAMAMAMLIIQKVEPDDVRAFFLEHLDHILQAAAEAES